MAAKTPRRQAMVVPLQGLNLVSTPAVLHSAAAQTRKRMPLWDCFLGWSMDHTSFRDYSITDGAKEKEGTDYILKLEIEESYKYKIIDNKTQSVFVPNYNEDSLELYTHIKNQEFLTKHERQLISQYSVQIYDKFLRENIPLINIEKCGVLVWTGAYSKDFGLPFIQDFKTIII